jgi:hypothetical protein
MSPLKRSYQITYRTDSPKEVTDPLLGLLLIHHLLIELLLSGLIQQREFPLEPANTKIRLGL